MKTPGSSNGPSPRDLTRLCTLGLSTREAEVLFWLARGGSNKEIGDTLHISAETVKSHVKHIFERLGVSNRTLAAIRANEAMRD